MHVKLSHQHVKSTMVQYRSGLSAEKEGIKCPQKTGKRSPYPSFSASELKWLTALSFSPLFTNCKKGHETCSRRLIKIYKTLSKVAYLLKEGSTGKSSAIKLNTDAKIKGWDASKCKKKYGGENGKTNVILFLTRPGRRMIETFSSPSRGSDLRTTRKRISLSSKSTCILSPFLFPDRPTKSLCFEIESHEWKIATPTCENRSAMKERGEGKEVDEVLELHEIEIPKSSWAGP